MQQQASIGTDLALAASLLTQGKLVAIPTETVYGLAANALDAGAVASIFAAKNRPYFDPLIVHTSSLEQVYSFVASFPEPLLALATKFWPGPLTLLLSKGDIIPDLVTAGGPRVGIRVPNHPLALALLGSLDFPLAAPSANPFGYISPTTALHVQEQLGDRIDYILDGGPAAVGLESTIVGLDVQNAITVYRLGAIPIEDIERLVGPVKVISHSTSNPSAPGQLESHYAPRVKAVMAEDIPTEAAGFERASVGFIRFNEPLEGYPHQWVLSPEGNLTEAAANLFSVLRLADATQLKLLVVQPVPDIGLGRAINDKLRRATAPRFL